MAVHVISGAAVALALAALHAPGAPEALAEGNRLYAAGSFEGARAAYEACLRAAPSDPFCQTNLASLLLDVDAAGYEADAERLYRAVVDRWDEVGREGMEAGGEAAAAAESSVAADAAFNLAMLLQGRKTEEATREACAIYARVLKTDGSRWDALCNRAACLHDLQEEPVAAFTAYTRAIIAGEGVAGDDLDPPEMAGPLSTLYLGLGTLLASADEVLCAELYASEGAEVLLDDVSLPLVSQCRMNARNALLRALELAPNPRAEHALAALDAADGGEDESGEGGASGGGPDRASPAFVEALFDDFAPTFDSKLETLEYRVPELVANAVATLAATRGATFARALDAGCGTGLLGPLVRPHVRGALVGVDLSTRMLRRAQGLGVYDTLAVADLLDLGRPGGRARGLNWDGASSGVAAGAGAGTGAEVDVGEGWVGIFDLVLAADVLVYFGDLAAILARFAALAAPGGVIIFSCEALEALVAAGAVAGGTKRGWAMNAAGRYAHSRVYVEAMARRHGLQAVAHEEITPRLEKGAPVVGHLFTFAAVRASGSSSAHSDDDDREL